MKKKVKIILVIILAAVFCVSAFMLIRDLVESHREKAAYDKLADLVHSREQTVIGPGGTSGQTGSGADGTSGGSSGYGASHGGQAVAEPDGSEHNIVTPVYAESGILYQYDAVYDLNNDFTGWLYAEGTGIDYPVMYTPNNEQYYLRRNFEKNYATGGTLFIGKPWSEDSTQTIIYGHNMRDGSMFGHLNAYTSKDYALEHNIIRFDTLHEMREYEVIAAFYGKVYNVDETGVFRYYRYTDLSKESTFNEFMKNVRSAAIYDTGVDVQFGDRILTLSTCSYHTSEGRLVIVARQRVPQTDE